MWGLYSLGIEVVDGRYELKRRLGSGAFSTVWLAHDRSVGIDVAVKILAENWATNDEFCERFIGEARLAMQSQSSRMVRVLNVGETDGRPFMAMAYAAGGTLAERIQSRRDSGRSFTVEEICSIGADLALALADLHERGLVHRDLKPANVLIYLEASGETLLLGDFGLARSLENRATTMIAGSPGYIAPEQALGAVLTEQADLFPLGVILVEMCTGTSFERAGVRDAFDFDRDVARSALPHAGLTDLLSELTDHDPTKRPTSARHVAERLQAIAADGQRDTVVSPAEEERAHPSRSTAIEPEPDGIGRARMISIAAALVLALGLGAFGISQFTGEDTPTTAIVLVGDDIPIPSGAEPVEGVSTIDRPVVLHQANIATIADAYDTLEGWTRSPATQNADGSLSFTLSGPRTVEITLVPISAQTTEIVAE